MRAYFAKGSMVVYEAPYVFIRIFLPACKRYSSSESDGQAERLHGCKAVNHRDVKDIIVVSNNAGNIKDNTGFA
jgi:hypothetical protein